MKQIRPKTFPRTMFIIPILILPILLFNFVLIHTKESQADCKTNCSTVKAYTRRSDSRHKYIQLAASAGQKRSIETNNGNNHANRYQKNTDETESIYGALTVTPGYRATFRPQKIAERLFGDHIAHDSACCGDHAIRVQGSALTNRNPKAWLADYFYLPRNYNGFFTITPRIKTFFINMDLYIGLDNCLNGLYGRIYGDLVHTRWNLNFCDNPTTSGTPLDHPHGYFSPANYEGGNLLQTFTDYAKGDTPQSSQNVSGLSANTPGNGMGIQNSTLKFNGLKYAKILTCSQRQTGFADLRLEFGWNCHSECSHLGINIQAAAPTGAKACPEVLFDAMVGNGNHWEVGGGITGHYTFWSNKEENSHFGIHLDVNLTHLFNARTVRTFDLRGKPNSAYMLAAQFGSNSSTPAPNNQVLYAPSNSAPNYQFAGVYTPVANLSTIPVDISIGLQSDIVIMLDYTEDCFSWNIGYNFWGTTCEKIKCPENCTDKSNTSNLCDPSQQNTWALKGDARLFGYEAANPSTIGAIPLSATQNKATILSGTNMVAPANVAVINAATIQDINSNIDSPALGVATNGLTPLVNVPTTVPVPGSEINTSTEPLFLSCNSIDLTRIRGLSHTLFTHISYIWEKECLSPYLGVGASAEFSHMGNSCCTTPNDTTQNNSCEPCGSCLDCAVSEWGIWISGGILFS